MDFSFRSLFSDLESGIDGLSPLMPDWAVTALAILVFVLAALVVNAIIYRILRRLVANRDLFWRSLVPRTRGPVRLAMVVAAVAIAAGVSPLTDEATVYIRRALIIAFIVCLAWAARTALQIWITIHLRRFSLDSEDNLLARKHVTQFRILGRVANTLIVVIAVAATLMTFPGVRQYGVSLLASAGAAGIVVGLALQPLLKNIFAGIQLAITQPIRIDDAVIVEGEWGNIEEITSTYVVVRIWDRRRLIVPLNYFIEQPFQNWTREGASLLGAVTIYLDYTVPVDWVRARVRAIAEESDLWDGDAVAVQVTDFKERVMEVRALVSASNSGKAFELRCEVREKLVAALLEHYPHALPRTRTDLTAAEAVPVRPVNADRSERRSGGSRDSSS